MTTDSETLAQQAAAREHEKAATELAGIVNAHLGHGSVAEDVPPAEPVARAPAPDWSQGSGSNRPPATDPAHVFAAFLLSGMQYPFAGRTE